MYLTVSYCVVNIVLFQHIRDNEQRLIYYVSKVMVDAKMRYSQVEQIALALKIVAQKLCPYFQTHQVTALTNQPLQVTLHKPDLFERMMKWIIKLSEYEIKYQSRLSLERHIMTDFIVELS